MGPNGFVQQIQQLRALERRQMVDYSEQAQEVLRLRLQTIEDTIVDPAQAARMAEKTRALFETFMMRKPGQPSEYAPRTR